MSPRTFTPLCSARQSAGTSHCSSTSPSSCATSPSNARSARFSTTSRTSTAVASACRRPWPTWTKNARSADHPSERIVIVVDASVLANALADDQAAGEDARGELRAADQVTAPDLVDVETVSVLRKRWLGHTLSDQRYQAAVGHLQQLRFERVPTLRLVRRAFELRANVSAYDACYAALAERLDCELITADGRLGPPPGPGGALPVPRRPA